MKQISTLVAVVAVLILRSVAAQTPVAVPPIAEDLRYWTKPTSAMHTYREIELRYVVLNSGWNSSQAIPVVRLAPFAKSLGDPTTEGECKERTRLSLEDIFDLNRPMFNGSDRLWVDWDGGIIGLQAPEGVYFTRIVCLPMALVDDLDRVGLQYRSASVPGHTEAGDSDINDGYDLAVTAEDPRREVRYNPTRFFRRFAYYGITPELLAPDTQPREAWDSPDWNTQFRVFPMGEATKLSEAAKQAETRSTLIVADPSLMPPVQTVDSPEIQDLEEERQKALEWLDKPRSEWE